MDELIKLIAEKTGISPEQAKVAAETVLTFLKGRLPGPLATQVDSAVNTGNMASKLAGAAKGLGGLFGAK